MEMEREEEGEGDIYGESKMEITLMAAQHWSNCEEIPHIKRQRRSPSKTVGGAKSH